MPGETTMLDAALWRVHEAVSGLDCVIGRLDALRADTDWQAAAVGAYRSAAAALAEDLGRLHEHCSDEHGRLQAMRATAVA